MLIDASLVGTRTLHRTDQGLKLGDHIGNRFHRNSDVATGHVPTPGQRRHQNALVVIERVQLDAAALEVAIATRESRRPLPGHCVPYSSFSIELT